MRRRLSRRTPDELAALASALVTPPDPTLDADGAARALELLLLVPGEEGRARRLLDGLTALDAATGQAAPSVGDRVRWRFRLDARALTGAERADAAAWLTLLVAARAASGDAPEAVAEVSRLAASAWLEAQPTADAPLGAAWLAPVLDGRRVANVALALRRRPALAAPLAPMLTWLDDADALDAHAVPEGLDALVAAAEEADRAGDFATGTRLLAQAADAATEADGLDRALAARAALLVDPSLGPDAAALWTHVARRPVPAIGAQAPPPPRRDWSTRLAHLDPDTPATFDGDLALLEAAGSTERAAASWLARGDRPALLQAARLAHALAPRDRARLVAALAGASSDDERVLAADRGALDAAIARYHLLKPGPDRTILEARLLPLVPDAPPAPDDAGSADDPHSVENRLAAASDLLEARRLDAAGSVLTALMRRAEPGPHLARLATLVTRALEVDPPPADVRDAAARHLHAVDDIAEPLLVALTANPTGAYALHEELLALGGDVSRPDAYRVSALSAWLGIWRATETAPDGLALGPLMRTDAALLPLAAVRLAHVADPARAAADFVLAHAADADPDAVAADLLALSLKVDG